MERFDEDSYDRTAKSNEVSMNFSSASTPKFNSTKLPPSIVLPASDRFVRKVLRDFRVVEAGQKLIARVEGEGRIADYYGNSESEKRVFIQFMPEAEWLQDRVSFAKRWLSALRLHYLAFSLLPQLLVVGMLKGSGIALNPWLVAGALTATTLLHLACNLWNDYEDHLRGVDWVGSSGGSGAIQKLWIPAAHIRNAAVGFFLASLCVGFYLLGTLSWETNGKILVILGVLGTIGAASYSGWPIHYKYLAMGEILVFFLCGPLVAAGALTLLAPHSLSYLGVALAAYPLGMQAVLRLHGGNLRRIPYDIQAGARTVANLIGFNYSKKLYILMLATLYVLVPVVHFTLNTSPLIFLSYLSAPVAWHQLNLIRRMKGPLDPLAKRLNTSSIYLDLSFGLLYTLGFFF